MNALVSGANSTLEVSMKAISCSTLLLCLAAGCTNLGQPSDAKPDLLPVPTMGNDFCAKTDQGRVLLITVKNIGKASTGSISTSITFKHSGRTVLLRVPGLRPGAAADLPAVQMQDSDF